MKEVKLSEIIHHLENGKTRADIKEIYSLSINELKTIFAHPLLKGKRTIFPTVKLIDDVTLQDGSFELVGEAVYEEENTNQRTIFDEIEEREQEEVLEEVGNTPKETQEVAQEDQTAEAPTTTTNWNY